MLHPDLGRPHTIISSTRDRVSTGTGFGRLFVLCCAWGAPVGCQPQVQLSASWVGWRAETPEAVSSSIWNLTGGGVERPLFCPGLGTGATQ